MDEVNSKGISAICGDRSREILTTVHITFGLAIFCVPLGAATLYIGRARKSSGFFLVTLLGGADIMILPAARGTSDGEEVRGLQPTRLFFPARVPIFVDWGKSDDLYSTLFFHKSPGFYGRNPAREKFRERPFFRPKQSCSAHTLRQHTGRGTKTELDD